MTRIGESWLSKLNITNDLARENISNRIMLYYEPILSTLMTWYFVTQRKLSSFYLDLQLDFNWEKLSVNLLSDWLSLQILKIEMLEENTDGLNLIL